jgi:O-antigen/teichoic acid export membrane protein
VRIPDDQETSATRARLDRALVHGLAWNAVSRWTAQLFRWAATLLTARLLLPEDYGIVGIAMVVVGLLHHVSEFGIGAAIIQQRSLSNHVISRIGGAALVIAVIMAGALLAIAPLAASFFHMPALRNVLMILSIRFIIDGYAVVPRSILARDLEFRRLSVLEGIESVLMAILTVSIAYVTKSYWALIAGNLISGLAFAVMVGRSVPMTPTWPGRLAEIRSQLEFGANVVASRLAWYAYSNADTLVVGRVLSGAMLGFYTQAWNIAAAPAEKLSSLVLRVAPSVLSQAKTHAGETRRYYLLLLRGVAIVSFPLAVGLALVAQELVSGVLGEKWLGAVAPLRFLALFFALRAIAALSPPVMLALGAPQVDRNISLVMAIVLPPLFYFSTRWGIAGVAATWLIAHPVIYGVLGFRWVLTRLEIPVSAFLRELWPATSATILMALIVALADRIAGNVPTLVRLFLLSTVGAAVYFVSLWIFYKRLIVAAWQLIRWRGSSGTGQGARQPGTAPQL